MLFLIGYRNALNTTLQSVNFLNLLFHKYSSISSFNQRAVNVLKCWIEQFWTDFQSDESLFAKLGNDINCIENPKFSQTLKTIISRKLSGIEAAIIEMTTDYPKPIIPKALLKKMPQEAIQKLDHARPLSMNWSSLSFKADEQPNQSTVQLKLSDIDPLEAARQLTLIEFDLFRKINPREFVGLSWMKEDKETRAPNIIRMVRWSNHVIQWLVTEIVSLKDNLKQRALMMEKIISIAKVCLFH